MKLFKKEVQTVNTAEGEVEIKYHKRKETLKEKVAAAAFLSPSFIGVMIFFVLPFFVVIYLLCKYR